MNKYRVHMVQVVSTTIEVEAENSETAIEEAFMEGRPGLMFLDHTYPDEGEWSTPSELFPLSNNPEDDWELIND